MSLVYFVALVNEPHNIYSIYILIIIIIIILTAIGLTPGGSSPVHI